MEPIAIKKISVQIGTTIIDLTVEESKQLQTVLNELFAHKNYNTHPYYETTQPFINYPSITWDNSETSKPFIGNQYQITCNAPAQKLMINSLNAN